LNLRQYSFDLREAVETYKAGGFILPSHEDQILELYKDGAWRRKHSMTVAAFLLGLPLPDPIIATRTPKARRGGVVSIVSGQRSLLSILTYLGCDTGHARELHSVPIYPRIKHMQINGLTSVQVDEIMGMRTIPITIIETEHEGTFEEGIYGAGAVLGYYWMWGL
jgi:hypothetical protein